MSKNTSSDAFRKIDVDALNANDDDVYREEDDLAGGGKNTVAAAPLRGVNGAAAARKSSSSDDKWFLNGPDDREVCNFLSQNRNLEALRSALKNPPYKSRDKTIRDRAILLVSKVLTSFRQSDIEKVVKNDLDQSEREILMKYVYKSFEYPQDNNSAQLLNWHEKLIQQCGLGIIVRVLTDMKRL